jgi:hypothetical protein
MGINVTTDETTVTLHAPYEPTMPSKARAIGGRWDANAKTWVFDLRDEERVRELAREVYGTDGTASRTVTVRLSDPEGYAPYSGELYLFGRMIARRRGRDEPVRLGDGVIIVSGGFADSGGSVKNPRLEAQEGTVLEVRDVPADHADIARARDHGDLTIVDTAVDRDALVAEQQQLRARLSEIEKLLGS